MPPEPWVSVEQATQRLGVAKDNVYRWREHQDLLVHRVLHLPTFKQLEGDEWVRAGGTDEGKNQQSGGVA